MGLLARLGFGILFYIFTCIRKGWYRGGQIMLDSVQGEENTFTKRTALALFSTPLRSLFREYENYEKNIERDRLSTVVIEDYSDDSLMGYGDQHFDKGGGQEIREQQRGLILPVLEKAIEDLIRNGDGRKTIVELGAANGDVIAYLAAKFPTHTFIGVDLSIRTMEHKHGGHDNLKFVKGYGLDLLESNSLRGDIIFGSSTWCLFTPKELARYFKSIRASGFSHVILNEPSWGGYRQSNDNRKFSRYLDHGVWFHNYAAYLKSIGMITRTLDSAPYKHPRSIRPDIYCTVLSAST